MSDRCVATSLSAPLLSPATPAHAVSNIHSIKKRLTLHDHYQYESDILIHPDFYSNIFQPGALVRISQPTGPKGYTDIILRLPNYELVKTRGQGSASPNFQISLSKRVSTMCEFVPRRDVVMELYVDEKSLEVDLLLLTFRDHYIGRADMYHIKLSLVNEFVFSSMKLSFGSIHLTVQQLSNGTVNLKSGIITKKTKIAFRSRSAKMFLFLQMSSEMWEFAEDSDLYFERCTNKFLSQLFSKWKTLQTNHSVTIIFFSRVFYTKQEVQEMKNNGSVNQNMPILSLGTRYYRDFYKVIVDDETLSDWSPMIKILKQEFMKYPSLIEWTPPIIQSCTTPQKHTYKSIGENSKACDGNILEAINLTLSEFSKHYINRDLKHTGQSILIISPGSCYFRVDRTLADLTKQKIIDSGIGCDMICVGRPPLHAVPLFHYSNEFEQKNEPKKQTQKTAAGATNIFSFLEGKQMYKFPFWVYVSFYQPSHRQDVLVSNLLESAYGWKSSYEASNQHVNKLLIPKVHCRGIYASWMDQRQETTKSEESILDSIDFHQKSPSFPRHSRSASKTLTISSLNVRKGSGYENNATDRTTSGKFSFESSESFGSLNEPLSVGSFSTDSVPSFVSVTPSRNKHRAVNPFELSVVSVDSSSSRRWSHVYPRVADRKRTERNVSAPNLFTSEANWKSFTEPVCLPLGTDYMPSQAELNKDYLQGAYTLSLLPGEDVYHNKMEDLLQELVSQRLAQNYQLVSLETQGYSKTQVLALGHIFHAITYDEIAQNITVKRFHLKHKMNEINRNFKYHYTLWPVNNKSFIPSYLDIHHTGELHVNWNAVDQLICGESSDLGGNLRLWHIQLVVLPNEKLLSANDDTNQQELEDKKISAFLSFTKNLFRNRIFKDDFNMEIDVVSEFIGNLATASSRSVGEIGSPAIRSNVNEDESLSELVSLMRHPNSGLDIRDRRKTITRRTQRRCFVARELIDWILRNTELATYSRECAVELAQKLLLKGFFKPVSASRARLFEDSNTLYRFTDDQNLVNIRKASLRQKKHKPIHSDQRVSIKKFRSTSITLDLEPEFSSSEERLSSPGEAFSLSASTSDATKHRSMEYKSMQPPSLPEATMSPGSSINSPACRQYFHSNEIRSAKIQVEERSKKTDRYQWIVVQYDKLYYPSCCYHIGIKWMICTGSSIQEVIAHLERHAKQSGVTILQVPVEREHIGSAFRTSVTIEVPSEVDKHSLLLRFGFLLDRKVDGFLEYMHRTGVAFIRCTSEGFIWNYNYTPTLQVQMPKAVSLLKELIDVCEDLGSDSDSDDECVPNLFAQ